MYTLTNARISVDCILHPPALAGILTISVSFSCAPLPPAHMENVITLTSNMCLICFPQERI